MATNMSFMGDGLTLENNNHEDQTVALIEGSDVEQESLKYQPLVSYILDRRSLSKEKRFTDEQRWLRNYRDYRGIYGPEVRFTDTEKSQAFMKITKTKVNAAYAQVTDVLFAGNRFPIGVESSPVPEGIAESVYIDPKEQPEEETGTTRSATISRPDILENVGKLKNSLERVKDKVKEGPGLTPTALTWEPAKDSSRHMDKQIQDQLSEANASKALRSSVFEMCLFGHGIFKGPLARDKEYPKWDSEGSYTPVVKQIPDVCFVSIWDAYPDPSARNMDEAEFFIERHKMSKTDLRSLKKRPFFREKSIELAIEDGPNYTEEYWEYVLRDQANESLKNERFEVLEYWGNADSDFEEIAEMKLPKNFKDKDQIQINAWICNGQLLRLVFNPFTPARIPYHGCPYEMNPYSFFGIGVAENMQDSQLLMNGMMRMAVDNAVLSSNIVFEVNDTMLIPGQDMKMYPGKIIRTQGPVGQSVYSHKWDNVTQECLMLFDKARQLADEATGIPSYSHGMSGIQSTGKTAAGMSMLMGAAAQSIKSVVRNIDDYLLVPFGKSIFAWNMQFNFDKDIVGDLEVVARGTESLMRNEVRSQKLLQFMQLTNNPTDAPWVKRDYILRELAVSLDLESDKVVNDSREAGIQALLLQELQKAQGINPTGGAGQGQGGGNTAGMPSMDDPTGNGGGNIAPGAAPEPGMDGFTGNG